MGYEPVDTQHADRAGGHYPVSGRLFIGMACLVAYSFLGFAGPPPAVIPLEGGLAISAVVTLQFC